MIKVSEFLEKQDISGGFARISEVIAIKERGQKEIAHGIGETSWKSWAHLHGIADMTIKSWKVACNLQGVTISLKIALYLRGNIITNTK